MSVSQAYGDALPTIALAATGTARTKGIPVRNRRLSLEAVWTGTPTGVFSLQRSFDGGVSWKDVPGAAVEFTANGNAQPAGSAGSATWNFTNLPGLLWAVLYTATSGTGTLSLRWS